MVPLTWRQVNAWRLSQHHLDERAPHRRLLEVVARIGGLHAQLMSAAELSLWARVEDLSASDLGNALWGDRTLIKTWAMRGTLHLLPASEFPTYVGARGAYAIRRPPSWFTYHGVTPAEQEAVMEGVRATLDARAITREELAAAIAKRTQAAEASRGAALRMGIVAQALGSSGRPVLRPESGAECDFCPAKRVDWEMATSQTGPGLQRDGAPLSHRVRPGNRR